MIFSIFQNEKSTTPVPKSITPTSSGGSTPGSSGIKSLPKAPPLGKFEFNQFSVFLLF